MIQQAPSARYVSLFDALNEEWIKLPYAAIRECGPAAQTLGGLLRVTNRSTFTAVENISGKARVPLSTCRKHLTTLHKAGWVTNEGRQATRKGYLRRTATISLTSKAKEARHKYGFLPWWACATSRKRLPWSAKVILSVVMAKLCAIKSFANDDNGFEDFEESFLDFEDRFRFSLNRLEKLTGLSRHSIIDAKQRIAKAGLVIWTRGGGDHSPDLLVPNPEFRAVITPAQPGYIRVSFDRVKSPSQ